MEEKNQYTISIYSENNVGLLNRVSAIFLKRHVNIMSFATSQSEIKLELAIPVLNNSALSDLPYSFTN